MPKIGDRYAEFLEKILLQTKDDKLTWHYLDENESLYEGMNWTRRSTHIGPFGEQIMLRRVSILKTVFIVKSIKLLWLYWFRIVGQHHFILFPVLSKK